MKVETNKDEIIYAAINLFQHKRKDILDVINFILSHPLVSIKEDEPNQPEKEIMGYKPKQISGVTDAIIAICCLPQEWDGQFHIGTYVHKKLISLNTLENWCVPVYKEVEKTLESKLTDIIIEVKNSDLFMYEAVEQIKNVFSNHLK